MNANVQLNSIDYRYIEEYQEEFQESEHQRTSVFF